MPSELRPTPARHPFLVGAGEKLKGVADWINAQEAKTAAGQFVRGAAAEPFSDLGTTLERVGYGERLTKGAGETLQLRPETIGPATAMIPGGPVGKKLAVGAAEAVLEPVGKRAAQRGAITVGGDPGLMMSHETSLTPFVARATKNQEYPRELYSPSMGVTRASLMQGFGSPGNEMWFIPREGAFDPKHTPTALFNRDAYTPRWREFPGAGIQPAGIVDRAGARDRLTDRFEARFKDAGRWGEGASGHGSSHSLAVQASPRFQSLEHYEKSPRGAGLLIPVTEHSKVHSYERDFDSLLTHVENRLSDVGLQINKTSPQAFQESLGDLLTSAKQVGDPVAVDLERLFEMARFAPSNYAEAKAFGPVQIAPDKFAGIVIDPSNVSDTLDVPKLIATMEDQYKLPVWQATGGSDPYMLARGLQSDAKRRGGNLFVGAGAGKPKEWPIEQIEAGEVLEEFDDEFDDLADVNEEPELLKKMWAAAEKGEDSQAFLKLGEVFNKNELSPPPLDSGAGKDLASAWGKKAPPVAGFKDVPDIPDFQEVKGSPLTTGAGGGPVVTAQDLHAMYNKAESVGDFDAYYSALANISDDEYAKFLKLHPGK